MNISSISNLITGFSSLLIPINLLANVQICQIKYGAKEVHQKKAIDQFMARLNNNQVICHQIGTEFNKFGEAEKNKPIFACCKPDNIFN